MIQTARYPAMDASLAPPKRPDYADDTQNSGGMQYPPPTSGYLQGHHLAQQDAHSMQPLTITTAESRARKRFQRTASENEDPLRKSGFSMPFGRGSNAQPAEQKTSQHARRRSTLRDNKAPLLGPRPFQNNR